eukprot:962905-Amphidinium_carterae.1
MICWGEIQQTSLHVCVPSYCRTSWKVGWVEERAPRDAAGHDFKFPRIHSTSLFIPTHSAWRRMHVMFKNRVTARKSLCEVAGNFASRCAERSLFKTLVNRRLNDVPIRCQNWRMRLPHLRVCVLHCPIDREDPLQEAFFAVMSSRCSPSR